MEEKYKIMAKKVFSVFGKNWSVGLLNVKKDLFLFRLIMSDYGLQKE